MAHVPGGGLQPGLSRLDRWGIVLSSLCLVHCILLPVALALLPAVAATVPGDAWVHPVLIALALPVTGTALWRGFRQHRSAGPFLIGVAGLGLIASALLFRETALEQILTVLGGLTVSAAHILNWRRQTHRCDR